jgi:hypothetical protein
MRAITLSAVTLACAVLLGACSASGPIDPQYVDRGTPENPRKCKTVTPVGTKIGQRICMLQSDWDAMSDNASGAVRDIQTRSAATGQGVLQD